MAEKNCLPLLEDSGLLVASHKEIPHTFSANIHNSQVVRQFQITVLISAPTVHTPNATSKLHFTRAYVRDIRAECS